METLINQIVALSGPLPSEAGFKRYLDTLSETELRSRLQSLQADRHKPGPSRWFSSKRMLEKALV